jgi:hypothetical protein
MNKKDMRKTCLILLLLFCGSVCYAQQIPVGSCGIVHVYDAAGNRTKRVYFCNNGSDPYPQRAVFQTQEVVTTEFQEVDALYPNPTTGSFSVTFSKKLNNSKIYILNSDGKVLERVNASGNQVNFDLSGRAAGVYYVRIEEKGKVITKKVVKQ